MAGSTKPDWTIPAAAVVETLTSREDEENGLAENIPNFDFFGTSFFIVLVVLGPFRFSTFGVSGRDMLDAAAVAAHESARAQAKVAGELVLVLASEERPKRTAWQR